MPRRVAALPIHDVIKTEKRELVQRIVSSRAFTTSPALRAFLLYVAEHGIEGQWDDIKEQQIGVHVLGRRGDYDPSQDNIVRVRARQLRQRLEEYFSGEGQTEPIVLTIPKGGYIPVFGPRLTSADSNAAVAVGGSVVSAARHSSWALIAGGCLAALTLAAMVMGFASFTNTRNVQKSLQTAAEPSVNLWGQFFPFADRELEVVSADSGFALWQDITGRNLNLGDYLSRRYLEDAARDSSSREVAVRRITSPADLSLSLRLQQIATRFGGHVKPQFARNLDVQDLRAGNVVLLGSRRSNPWVQLFEAHLNFILEDTPRSRGPRFLNKAPKPGEMQTYEAESRLTSEGSERKEVDSYALAALSPSLAGRGRVLIFEGLSMEGTEAAGELLMNPERLADLLRQMGAPRNTAVQPFEALLKLSALAGTYENASVVAFRND